jgi:hypothetical protein
MPSSGKEYICNGGRGGGGSLLKFQSSLVFKKVMVPVCFKKSTMNTSNQGIGRERLLFSSCSHVWFGKSTSTGLVSKEHMCWFGLERVKVQVWLVKSTSKGLVWKEQSWALPLQVEVICYSLLSEK